MAKKPASGFAAAAAKDAESKEPSADALEKLRAHVKEVRNLTLEIEDREEALNRLKTARFLLLSKTLPDMFTELGIKSLELEPEGNTPAFTAKAAPFYKANIAADWPDDKRQKSFEWLRKNKLGDLIRTEFVVELGKDTAKQQKELKAALKKLKIPYDVSEAVPHTTLTAVFKNMVEKEGKTPPLDILGASMGTVVQVKAAKAPQRRTQDGI
jgi:hypothetical protein